MEAYRSEEEQLEAIKEWWRKNGNALLLALAIGIAAVAGWKMWQNHQASQRAAAANHYQELLQAMQNDDANKRESSMSYITDQLQKQYASSVYAVFGSLALAKEQLQSKADQDKAITNLQWAYKHAQGQNLKTLINERLARAQFALGKLDQALNTLSSVKDPGAYKSQYEQLKGDIYRQQGKMDQARDAYKAASKAAGDQTDPLLKLKMQDMAIPEAN